jgi:hypothetical protein
MVVWALTAGIGIYLLAVGISGQRAGAIAQQAGADVPRASRARVLPRYESVEDNDPDTGTEAEAGSVAEAGSGADAENVMATGVAALATVLEGQRSSGERAGAAGPAAEGSPLLEFIHPALALLGLTFWICFVASGDRLFAWIAFGVVVATVVAGLGWEIARRRTAGRREDKPGGASFPPHLIMLHGAAAACTFALVVIAAVVASHG